MLDVADIDELVLQFGHAIPTEATIGAVEIQRVYGVIDHAIAEFPVLEHFPLRVRLTPDAVALPVEDRFHDLLALDEALDKLARREPRKAELVKLRYFAGLSFEEAAACLDISPVTAKRYWAVAHAWLYAALSADEVTGPGKKNFGTGDTPSS